MSDRVMAIKQWLNRYHYWILVLILLLSICLRFTSLLSLPAGSNPDEISSGYEAFSLLHHGTDRWGNAWPVYFVSWGSGQNVLLSYLEIPFIKVLGLTTLSIRIIPALLGVLSVLLVYLLLKKTRGLALTACLLLAVLPWATLSSRWGLESSIMPFFILLGLYTFTRTIGSHYFALSLIPFALATYAYIVSIVIIPPLIVLMGWLYREEIKKQIGSAMVAIAITGVLCLPLGMFTMENFVLHRIPHTFSHLPITAPLLLESRLTQVNSQTSDEGVVWSNLHYITSGFVEAEPWFNINGYIVAVYLPVAGMGVLLSLRSKYRELQLFTAWFFCSFMVMLISPASSSRMNGIIIPMCVLAAYGALQTASAIKDKRTYNAFVFYLSFGTLLYFSVFYVDYFAHYNHQISYAYFNDGFASALKRADHIGGKIYVSQTINLNYMYVLFYEKADSRDFRLSTVYYPLTNNGTTLYHVDHYRNYYFDKKSKELSNNFTYILKDTDMLRCRQHTDIYSKDGWRVGTCRGGSVI